MRAVPSASKLFMKTRRPPYGVENRRAFACHTVGQFGGLMLGAIAHTAMILEVVVDGSNCLGWTLTGLPYVRSRSGGHPFASIQCPKSANCVICEA